MKKILIAIIFLLCLGAVARAQYDRDVFFLRGRQALSDGKYALAIENFNVLARLDTNDYWNFFFRGIAKYNLGDLRGAQKDFERSVRINPVFTNGYHYRAITKSRNGQYEDALTDLQTAIELRPGFDGLYYSRGVTYFLAQRFEEAVAEFDRYIRKEPKDPGAYLNRGASYLYMRDTTKALADYNKAISLDRFEPEGYVRRGRVYAARSQWDLAIADMNEAISLDPDNTFAYFNRALLYAEIKDYNAAMADLNRVLKDEPGNALTLYNRSLLRAQVGNYREALEDMDRVIAINPGNVLAHYNRAALYMELGKWQHAIDDYTSAIELYPDFANAYLNRSYAENMIGRKRASKADYETAQKKIREYRSKNASGLSEFADTTKKYSSLLALDAEFAKKDFNDELLQNKEIDIKLRPLYEFSIGKERSSSVALSRQYENPLMDRFIASCPLPLVVGNSPAGAVQLERSLGSILSGDDSAGAGQTRLGDAEICFVKGLYEAQQKQYNSALMYFDRAAALAESDAAADKYAKYFKAFYLMNRGVLRAKMIDFIASIAGNVQTLTMDESGTAKARVGGETMRSYDYSEAIADIREAIEILPDIPYLYFDLGNLYSLSSQFVSAIECYDKAIRLHPSMGDAWYNRALVQIFLKEKEKGCIDLSRAGELGVAEAYRTISKYCKGDEN